MATAFILGNGISRQAVNLHKLKDRGPIYGCNALHREFVPNALVATDKPISVAIQESGYALEHKFYTRKPLPNLGGNVVPEPYYGFSSGPIAVGLAAMHGHRRIYLLGFDMGPNKENQFNNIYADTEFYKKTGSPPTFTGNWARQIKQVITDHTDTEFIRVFGETTAIIEEINNLKNLRNMPMVTFLDRINNEKDL
jgi:hypothetical protein